MTQRWLAASPFVFVALTAAVFALVPAGARELVVQGEIDLSKLLALAGLTAAALAFERGDYLRRGWGLWAACYVLLLGRDGMLLVAPHVSPLAFEIVRGVLVGIGNGCVVAGTWMLARAWSVAGLEHPGPRSARWAAVAVGIIATVVFAGPTFYVDVRDLLLGSRAGFDAIASDFGDLLSLPLIAPVGLTAVAVRGGSLRWTWMLLTASLLAWLLYDAVYTVPDLFLAAPSSLRLAAAQFDVLAGACACAAGLAQRKAVMDDEEEEGSGP
jgi:hypothetical protein